MMFAQMARDVEALLRAKYYPVRVRYGPQRFDLEGPHMQIRAERDRTTSDQFGAAPGPRSDDSRPIAQRAVPVVWTLYTRSAAPGATAGEEEALIDDLVDALFDALRTWGSTNKSSVLVNDGRLLTDDERGVEAISTGEAYRMTIAVARGILSKDYRGEGRPTGTPTEVGEGTIKVSIDGTTYEDV